MLIQSFTPSIGDRMLFYFDFLEALNRETDLNKTNILPIIVNLTLFLFNLKIPR